jgi:hypothetical protein
MTTFEKCQAIRRMLINRAAEVMAYKNWGDDFAAKQIRNFPEELMSQNSGPDFFGIQPADLTEAEMVDLGFGKWSKETPMRLIPLWLFPFLADEMETECIDGEKKTLKKADMDNDNRFGCLAYGVVPKSA